MILTTVCPGAERSTYCGLLSRAIAGGVSGTLTGGVGGGGIGHTICAGLRMALKALVVLTLLTLLARFICAPDVAWAT